MGSDRKIGSTSAERVFGRLLWVRWGLLLAWMALIFRLSATPDLRAVPLIQRFHLLPAVLGVEMTNLLELLLRKAAHMAAFGVLALLALWTLEGAFPAWSRRLLFLASLAFAILYAASDEWHQTFVPTRDGTVRDVLIDTAGAVLALAVQYFRTRRRNRVHKAPI